MLTGRSGYSLVRPPASPLVSGGAKMIRLRLSLAMSMGAALVLAFPAIERPAGAQPEPKISDREPPKVVAELVGQIGERRASGPLGIAVSGDYAYLAAWRRGLRVVNISNP